MAGKYLKYLAAGLLSVFILMNAALADEYYAETPLAGASEEQRSNIRQAIQAIDGTRLEFGEAFSFNELVGPRSKERGFIAAENGRGVKVIGGGVAQTATTLYLTLMQQDGGFALCFDGYAVLGAGVGKGEGETWSGTWIFASASQPGEESLSRAQLILSAGRLLEKSGYTELKGITCVYLLTSLQSGDIRLLPALLLDTGSEQLCMNALTGEAALLPQK